MDKELNAYVKKKRRVSRKWLFLVFLCGTLFSLCTPFLAQTSDPELCYVNWKTVLNQTLLFGKLVLCLIIGYFRNYYKRYGGVRICLYMLFVTVTSYVIVVHCLDALALFTWDQLKGNLLRRLDDSIIVIDENRNESTSMRRAEEPLVVEEHFRYLDEDVRFKCYHVMSFESEVEPLDKQVIWMHNDRPVVPSWKYKIHISFIDLNNTNNDVHSYIINSTLTIYLIEDSDFGNYSCYLRESAKRILKEGRTHNSKKQKKPEARQKPFFADDITDCICAELKNTDKELYRLLNEFYQSLKRIYMLEEVLRQNSYQWTGEFKLTKIDKSILIRSAPPGAVISVSASYLNLADKQDISLAFVINDKPFLDVCSSHQNACSQFILIYWLFWHPEGHFSVMPQMISYWLSMTSSILGKGWYCACPSTYGIHLFRFYRHFYNVTSGRDTIIEVEHPQAIRLIPRTADVLLTLNNDSKAKPIGEQCFNSVSLDSSCSWVESFIYELHSNFFLIEQICFSLMINLGALLAYICCKPIVRCLVAAASFILDGSVWEQPRSTLAGIGQDDSPARYDIYISHADSQWEVASDLASLLESFGKKVFYRERDVAIGDFTIHSVAKAITSSRMFLVIVSSEYIKSNLQNEFEMQMMLNQILKRKVAERNVMLYKLRRCRIPVFFCNCTNMQILDTSKTCLEERIGKLKRWSDCNSNERLVQLFSFLSCVSTLVLITVWLGYNKYKFDPFNIA